MKDNHGIATQSITYQTYSTMTKTLIVFELYGKCRKPKKAYYTFTGETFKDEELHGIG
jgi:hypothetical protein